MSQKIIMYIRDIPDDICRMITNYIIILSIHQSEMCNKKRDSEEYNKMVKYFCHKFNPGDVIPNSIARTYCVLNSEIEKFKYKMDHYRCFSRLPIRKYLRIDILNTILDYILYGDANYNTIKFYWRKNRLNNYINLETLNKFIDTNFKKGVTISDPISNCPVLWSELPNIL
jgi:hypothetical protein